MKNEFSRSDIEYKIGTIIEDDITKDIFKVVGCEKVNGSFRIELSLFQKNETKEIFEKLKECLNTVKLHDKDLFMVMNIISTLEDSING